MIEYIIELDGSRYKVIQRKTNWLGSFDHKEQAEQMVEAMKKSD